LIRIFRELIAPLTLLRFDGVLRFRFWLAVLLAVSGIIVTVVQAQLTDEEREKRAQFLKTRAVATASPDESPSPAAKAQAAKRKKKTTPKPSPSETPEAKKAKSAAEAESPSPTPKKSPSAKSRKSRKPGESPSTKKKHSKRTPTPFASPKESPKRLEEAEKAISMPRASAVPTPPAPARPGVARAIAVPSEAPQVTIEKSGFEGEQALEPPPPPPPRRRFFFWPFSRPASSESYRYLTRSVIDQIRRAPVQRRRWQFIVVHNSGTRQGNARVFDYYHRNIRRMRNGLAYHFVIGNGTSTGNGEVEVGDRWRRQINGGHVHSDYLNNIALGICLVGDFNRDQPTRAQLECCEELIRYLRQRCGKIDNHYPIVKPHREMNPPRWPTDCPGDAFPYSWFRRF
jgi:hypothetical protein